MQFNKEINTAKYQITKYSAGSITVNDQEFTNSLIITPNFLAKWELHAIRDIQEENLATILELKPEVVLLGSGTELIFPEHAAIMALFASKIGLEVMTTPAACRTYTALSSEGRNVLAALVV